MRNHTARVVLGACLGVTSAFAQAPVTSFESSSLQTSSGSSAGGDILHVPSFGARVWQDDEADYSVRTLFRELHGEFMDRRERYDPSAEVRVRYLPNQGVSGEPGSFDLIGYDFDVEMPVVIYPDAYLLFGLYHYGRHYNTNAPFGSRNNTNNPGANIEPNFGDENLTAAGVRLGFGAFLHPDVLLEVESNLGVYSDLDGDLGRKDFDFPSSALFTVRSLDNFFFKFGVRYNQIYEDAPWLPYLGFSWEVVDGVRIDLLAPEYLEVSFWPSASTAFVLGAEAYGAEYRVRSSAATGKQQSNVHVQEVVAYVGLNQRFSDRLSMQVRTGMVVTGAYDLTTGAESNPNPALNFDNVSGALDQGFYAEISFGIDW